jgi:hypothetical protein
VHAARPAEGEKGEFAGIEAALEADHPDRFLHVGVGDVDDPLGRLERRFPDPDGQASDRRPASLRLDDYPAAEEIIGIDASQDEIGVGDRRVLAPAVTSRAGVGAGASGADAQRPAGIDMGDRAAACPDRMNVDYRKADREIPDRVFVRPADIPVDQGDIGRRAAHVEADEFGKSGGPGQLERADDAPGRAGESGPDGLLPGFPGGRCSPRWTA